MRRENERKYTRARSRNLKCAIRCIFAAASHRNVCDCICINYKYNTHHPTLSNDLTSSPCNLTCQTSYIYRPASSSPLSSTPPPRTHSLTRTMSSPFTKVSTPHPSTPSLTLRSSYTKIGIVGAGSMGSCMAMLFAENGLQVSVYDVKGEKVDNLSRTLADGLASDLHQRVAGFKDISQFMDSLGGKDADKLLVFSIPHGSAADNVISQIRGYLSSGDVILDGGNEWYENAQRRQKELAPDGIAYISMGVCGGYQSARRGPSISPSGDKTALDRVMPLLEKVAAKDPKTGKPCVTNLGPAGCGHYVKMMHNGIEQGILGVVNEAWELLYKCLHTDLDTIAKIFKQWEGEGELVRTNCLCRNSRLRLSANTRPRNGTS